MRSYRLFLITLGLAGCAAPAGPDSAPPTAVDRSSAISATGLTITADLTPTRLFPPKYRYLGSTLPSGTISNYLGSLQYIDGAYYTVDPAFVIGSYKTRYYIVPSNAAWNIDKYGQFCGGGWGYPANASRPPISDGGLDAACREHDMAWSVWNVLGGDARFLSRLNAIAPRWQYEADYVVAAKSWMTCRVSKHVTVPTAYETSCGGRVISLGAKAFFSAKLIR
ncbi:MAG: hypothetical protein U0133_11850 [Gemmatimonadales bacterium]